MHGFMYVLHACRNPSADPKNRTATFTMSSTLRCSSQKLLVLVLTTQKMNISALGLTVQSALRSKIVLRISDDIVPPHFYGVMAKTDLGCQVLQEKGHFSEFAQFIRDHGQESDNQEIILKLKSVLWAVVSVAITVDVLFFRKFMFRQGNIGAAERGLPFLEEEEIIPAILEIAERSAICSVKG